MSFDVKEKEQLSYYLQSKICMDSKKIVADIQKNFDVITCTCDRAKADSICELLRAIKAKSPDDKRITLIMDNAAYNRSGKVKILAKKMKIGLFYLPPYSPNLNPRERLWKFMKKKVLYNYTHRNLNFLF